MCVCVVSLTRIAAGPDMLGSAEACCGACLPFSLADLDLKPLLQERAGQGGGEEGQDGRRGREGKT